MWPLAHVLGFEGLSGDLLGASKFSPRSDEAMDFISERKHDSQPFLKPGQVLERSWLPGVRVYVLGPPMDLDSIRDMRGSSSETFESRTPRCGDGVDVSRHARGKAE